MGKKKTVARKKTGLYSVHPGVQMMQDWLTQLPAKTGRSLEQWISHVKKKGPKTEKERRDWLKNECGLGTNSAWWIAERAEGKGGEDDTPEGYLIIAETWVEEMYAGSKSQLRPLHDRIIQLAQKVCADLKICPCKTIVPLYRNHVFAQIKPSTRTRIDLGFALGDMKPKGRLVDTGGFAKKDRITHRIPITTMDDIDDEVKVWIKTAYDRDK